MNDVIEMNENTMYECSECHFKYHPDDAIAEACPRCGNPSEDNYTYQP